MPEKTSPKQPSPSFRKISYLPLPTVFGMVLVAEVVEGRLMLEGHVFFGLACDDDGRANSSEGGGGAMLPWRGGRLGIRQGGAQERPVGCGS
mmetsp:Transcript_18957/g.49903  ORF Transcript_18957/g.49903 Transcript_18957/m.49903 type:complete len:92 (-) Transcript_18957:10-285(-)